jgi:hypothetical protein
LTDEPGDRLIESEFSTGVANRHLRRLVRDDRFEQRLAEELPVAIQEVPALPHQSLVPQPKRAVEIAKI